MIHFRALWCVLFHVPSLAVQDVSSMPVEPTFRPAVYALVWCVRSGGMGIYVVVVVWECVEEWWCGDVWGIYLVFIYHGWVGNWAWVGHVNTLKTCQNCVYCSYDQWDCIKTAWSLLKIINKTSFQHNFHGVSPKVMGEERVSKGWVKGGSEKFLMIM